MIILLVIHDLTGGGAEQQLNYLAPELVRRGHQVHIFYCKEGPNSFSLNGVSLYKANEDAGDFSFLWDIFTLARKIKPDIIHTWLLKMDILGGIISLILKIPWVFREPSSKLAYPLNIKNAGRILLAKLSDAILCNSKNGYDYWNNKVKSSKIHIVPNGLPLKLIRSVPSVEAVRFSKNGPTLLYAGRIVEGKNIDLIIKALADLNKRVNINCIICGEGDLSPYLIDLAKQLGLEESIRFIGHMPQISMWGLMKTVTGYVSLSAFEGCPNTTLEAMAIGVPVFLSNISAHLEIADEDNAIIIGLHDICSISAAFEKYLFDAETLQRRSKNAYERVTKFSIENMVDHHESIYYKLNYLKGKQ